MIQRRGIQTVAIPDSARAHPPRCRRDCPRRPGKSAKTDDLLSNEVVTPCYSPRACGRWRTPTGPRSARSESCPANAAGLQVPDGPVGGSILEGSAVYQAKDQPASVLHAGDVFSEPERTHRAVCRRGRRCHVPRLLPALLRPESADRSAPPVITRRRPVSCRARPRSTSATRRGTPRRLPLSVTNSVAHAQARE